MIDQTTDLGTALVVPCYNEEHRLPVQAFAGFIELNPSVFFVFVNDGSTDGTLERLQKLSCEFPLNIEVVTQDRNLGKAEAVRQGVLLASKSAKYKLLGYWDADLSTPLAEVHQFIEILRHNRRCRFVSGARILRMGSDISRHWYRHYLGRMFATGASFALNLPYYDTQCGAKVFRNQNIGALFGNPFSSRWLFDIELIYRFKNLLPREDPQVGFYEVPLKSWHEISGSKLSSMDFLLAPYELFKIWRRYS